MIRGAVHVRGQQRSPSSDEFVGGDEVGRFSCRSRREISQAGCANNGGCVDGDRHRRTVKRRGFGCWPASLGAPVLNDWQLEAARAGSMQLTGAVKAQAIELAIVRGKSRLGLGGPVRRAGPPPGQELVLKTVDDAVAAGFSHTWACSLWRVSDSRVHRWRALAAVTPAPWSTVRRAGTRCTPVAGRSPPADPWHRRTLGCGRPFAPQARPPRLPRAVGVECHRRPSAAC